ncbi:MAG: spermidine/putrescine ABC transporter substrate-binding protein PotF [Cereibacter sphaeroides]|uniref:Putrescine-binding periplasmic protein n=1 Tax=Cereibacter sphaeroides TaxID=1063 RepID=A0A2W5TJ25_CERSP|nr:MAG: spermidine/putrescine ABC transporter substrate-binding protein PotF [Cereibacter sphaeroides]
MTITRRAALGAGIAALATPFVSRIALAQGGTVNVYNWADYIGETTLADFEAATGITPVYDLYDSAEAAEAKLMAGQSGYDVVVTAGRNLPRFNTAGIMAPLDKAKLPNLAHMDPSIMEVMAKLDPGNAHALPYMWGTTGVTINARMVEELAPGTDPTSFDVIFKPEIAEKLASCGINIIDSPGTIIPMVLAYLGKDPMSEDPADLDAVVAAFEKVRPYIRSFDNNSYTANLANEQLCVTTNWAGDYAVAITRAKEAGLDIPLRYDVPMTGGTMWVDAFIIPADAPNKDNAHAFLDFMMRPDVIAAATNYTAYANANKDANALVDPSIINNPAVYPDDAVKSRVWISAAVSPEYDTARTRAWQRIMTGS